MTKEITQKEYESTMKSGMQDITETAEPAVDIWAYVEILVKQGIVSKYVLENFLVEKVYRSKDNKYNHVLLPTATENYFIVLVANIVAKDIEGHYLLDLNNLYR